MKKTLAIILTVAFVLSLGAAVLAYTPTAQHETIDGFDSFFTTGDVEVEAVPMLYNVRDSQLRTYVRVKAGDTGNYNRNTITLYHKDGDTSTVTDMVASTDTAAPATLGVTPAIDPDFVFDLAAEEEEEYQVLFENADNLEVSFVISTYISIVND